MKKKLLILVQTISILVFSTACAKSNQEHGSLMTLVDDHLGYAIYVHNETGVMYLCYGNGGVCVMVDGNGKPLIYNKGK